MSSSNSKASSFARRTALAAAAAGCAAWGPQAAASGAPLPSLCTVVETAVFSCQVSGDKTVSLCASVDLSEHVGTLTYRFGRPGRLELVFPKAPMHPKEVFRRGTIGSAGGSGDFLSFSRGPYTYTLWADIGPAGEHAGVAVFKDGQALVSLPCRTPALNPDEHWARAYKARLPREDKPFTPPVR